MILSGKNNFLFFDKLKFYSTCRMFNKQELQIASKDFGGEIGFDGVDDGMNGASCSPKHTINIR